MFPKRYLENEWSEGATYTYLFDVESGDLSIEEFSDRVSIENNELRYGISDQDGNTVPALRSLHAKSLSCRNMPQHFSSSGASFSSYSRKAE